MKTIIGNAARKKQFFKRPEIRKAILKALERGENLLLSAPRRVGKSSILLDLVDAPDEEYYAVFVDTEALDTSEEFFKIILKAILDTDKIEEFGFFKSGAKSKFKEWASKIAQISLGPVSFELNKAESRNHYEEFKEFLNDIDLEGKKILMLIDEFPITVEKIQEKYGNHEAIKFLGQNRALRQDPLFQNKIRFIYTGSIGLVSAVKRIKATDKINDLKEIKIPALENHNAEEFIKALLNEECNQEIPDKLITYILNKIEWKIPFYFQLLVRELSDMDINNLISEDMIDKAFEKMIENGDIYFQHFKDRLQKVFSTESLMFANEFLLHVKNETNIDYNKALNIAEKFAVRVELDNIIEILKHDGYIIEQGHLFKFYSPILKRWWK